MFLTLPRSLALLFVLLASGPLAAQTESILTNSDPVQAGWFGHDLDVDGDRMIVGAPGDLAGTASTYGVGAAVIYDRTASGWTETARLYPPALSVQRAGTSVALDGDRAVVGAVAFNNAEGAAYVYENQNGSWALTATLSPPTQTASQGFGYETALDGDRILVSAPGDAQAAGAVYVFDLVSGAWTQTAKLTASTPAPGAYLGLSLDTDGTTIVAGAPGTASYAGSAHVFQHNGTAWYEYGLAASSPAAGSRFGHSVAVDGAWIAVGENERTDAQPRQGATYLFEQLGNPWIEQARLDGGTPVAERRYGYSVDLQGTRLAVGEIANTLGTEPGRVYLYDYDGSAWTFDSDVQSSNGTSGDVFGNAVVLDGSRLAVGAYYKRDGSEFNAGAAYVYEFATPSTPAFLAQDAITVYKASAVSGDLHSNGAITLNRQSNGYSGSYASSLSAVGAITLDRRNAISGDVTAGGALSVHPSASVSGVQVSGASVASVALPGVVSASPGTQNKTVAGGTSQTLAPGAYRRVRVDGALTLTAGTYSLDKLVLRPGATLTFDVTGGPIEVHTATALVVARDVTTQVSGTNGPDLALSDQVTLRTAQATEFNIGPRSQVVGTVEAPLALVRLRADAGLAGSLAAREIIAANRVTLRAHGSASSFQTPISIAGPQAASLAAWALRLSASPNPLRQSAAVSFTLPEAAPVRLAVYDALGREVAVLADGDRQPGTHEATLDARALPAGVYILRLATPAGTATQRVTRVR